MWNFKTASVLFSRIRTTFTPGSFVDYGMELVCKERVVSPMEYEHGPFFEAKPVVDGTRVCYRLALPFEIDSLPFDSIP